MITKDAGFRLRVEKELRELFVEACREQGRPAAQIMREFMREYVEDYQNNRQGSLFETDGLDAERERQSRGRT